MAQTDSLLRDPRNPDPRYMVASGSTHPAHAGMCKTLALLMIPGPTAPICFVVEGVSGWDGDREEFLQHQRYFYEEHSCPTNFVRVAHIATPGDGDPHGLFEFVDCVWMTDEYGAREADGEEEEYLATVFPQLRAAAGGWITDAMVERAADELLGLIYPHGAEQGDYDRLLREARAILEAALGC